MEMAEGWVSCILNIYIYVYMCVCVLLKCLFVHSSFSHVQKIAAALPARTAFTAVVDMVAQGPGLPFGFPTWAAVPTTAGIGFLLLLVHWIGGTHK